MYRHLFGKEDDALERSASSISGEVMPTEGLPVILERGAVEIEVLFLSDILSITTGGCVREGLRESTHKTYRVQMGGWELA